MAHNAVTAIATQASRAAEASIAAEAAVKVAATAAKSTQTVGTAKSKAQSVAMETTQPHGAAKDLEEESSFSESTLTFSSVFPVANEFFFLSLAVTNIILTVQNFLMQRHCHVELLVHEYIIPKFLFGQRRETIIQWY